MIQDNPHFRNKDSWVAAHWFFYCVAHASARVFQQPRLISAVIRMCVATLYVVVVCINRTGTV